MIKIESLLYKLDLSLNKLASNEHQSIPVENKIIILRESILTLIKRKISSNNVLHVGFDANKKRYHDLQGLIEKAEDHELCLELIDEKTNKWGAELIALEPEMMFIVSGYVLADKGDCKDRVIVLDTEITKHSDVKILLKSADTIPSFEYQEAISSISGNTLEVYTDGTFDLSKAYISYIRYPVEVDYEGYCQLNGEPSSTVDCELPNYLESEILQIATESLATYTENSFAAQASERKAALEE